ncbi:hypothetical protein BIW11_13110 [Tropilaelaps mercedesae]|uniref:Uncharacterized protein n=1 Tax=Tropilaelaps mercedesae TaxID=418985 RepID=A0A1V9X3X9_9ACAR|nr:hypothetical protein BIW11_13110 [Tropilaelaps mercedesae]
MNKADYFGDVFGNSRSRNPLQVITNMFKRRNADPLDDEYVDELSCAAGGGHSQRPLSANPFTRHHHASHFHGGHVCSPTLSLGNRLRPSSPLSIPGGCGRFRQATSAEDILSISPSLRNARSLQEDMEMLRQSRQDNPYIQQQIEKFSILSEGLSRFDGHSLQHQDQPMSDSPATVPEDHQQLLFSSSPKDEDILSLTSQMDNRHEDLHQHLIRSPPPMFPQVEKTFQILNIAFTQQEAGDYIGVPGNLDVEQFVFEFSRTTSPQHLLGSPCSVRTQRQPVDSLGSNTPERGRLSRIEGLHSRRSQEDSVRCTPPSSQWSGANPMNAQNANTIKTPNFEAHHHQPGRDASVEPGSHTPVLSPPIKAWKRCTSPLSKELEPDEESLLVKSFDSAF